MSRSCEVTYPFSIVLAAAHVVGVGFAAFQMWLVGGFRWENETPEDGAANDWLVPVAGVLVMLAVAVLVGVIVRRWRFAAAGLVAEGAVAAIVFIYALGESIHSDHELVLHAASVTALGYSAVALSARPI
ncbi:MAG: hypothetical protein ACRDOF_05775 [Gaiellaceae bacterium]